MLDRLGPSCWTDPGIVDLLQQRLVPGIYVELLDKVTEQFADIFLQRHDVRICAASGANVGIVEAA